VFSNRRRKLDPGCIDAALNGEGNVELALVIVVLVVAGAMIPGNSKIRYYR
jgi:hypothetical protein